MMFAYRPAGPKLEKLLADAPLGDAVWIDLYKPLAPQVAALAAFGIPVPTLEDMEEIEISNRLYEEEGKAFLTVVLPGLDGLKAHVSGPVTFILTPERMVTVRHHAPRPFETYPDRADKVGPGCGDVAHLFLSLLDEIVGRLADHLEGTGKVLDGISHDIYGEGGMARDQVLLGVLRNVGRESDLLGRVRLSLLTLERALGFFGQMQAVKGTGDGLRSNTKSILRDIQSLEVHADFLASRIGMVSDAALGMVHLAQAQTIKIFSVLAVVFLPPTVIASAYGMNFDHMPELHWTWGYPIALVLMLASAVGTYGIFKWKKLL